MNAAEKHFYQTVPQYIHRFRSDMPQKNGMPCNKWDAVAVFGNAGHESIGFTTLQEMKPIVEGSAGGYGWMQWTGPRRRAFIAFCQLRGLHAQDDEANYQFLLHELRNTPEGKAMTAMFNKVSLDDKVVAFELAFLRAHKDYKHYAGRKKWAALALQAYEEWLTKNPGLSKPGVQPAAPVTLKPTSDDERGDIGEAPDTVRETNNKAVIAGGALAGLIALGYAIWKGVIGG